MSKPLDREEREERETDSDEGDDADEDDDDDDYDTEKSKRFSEAKLAIKERRRRFRTEDDLNDFLKEFGEVARQAHDENGTLLHAIVDLVNAYDITKVTSANVQKLVCRLTSDYPDLLRTPNDKGQNPMYLAISCKKWRLVSYMLDSCPINMQEGRVALDDALEAPCSNEKDKTCLHQAFEKDLDAGIIKQLVNIASDRALEAKDKVGKTAFHYAVKYSQCSNDRVDIIKLLLGRDQMAVEKREKSGSHQPLKTFLDCVDDLRNSVYLEHTASASQYIDGKLEKKPAVSSDKLLDQARRGDPRVDNTPPKQDLKATTRQKEGKQQTAQQEKERDRISVKVGWDRDKTKQDNDPLDERERIRQQRKRQEALEMTLSTGQHRPLGDPGQQKDNGSAQIQNQIRPDFMQDARHEAFGAIQTGIISNAGSEKANTPVKRAPTMQLDAGDSKTTTGKREAAASNKPKRSSKFDAQTLANNSEKIRRKLKLHYMRTRNIEMVTSFLYGKNPKHVQIYFDYNGLPLNIKETVFYKVFGEDDKRGIKFDEVLKYVRFTNVTVTRRLTPKDKGKVPSNGHGRRDMEVFLEWLHKKGVRRILKLVVEENSDGKAVHSDQAIKTALDKMMVEHLDWQKMDLDPQVIDGIGSRAESKKRHTDESEKEPVPAPRPNNKLKKLDLRWSGNNAVLRAWSEPEGLPLLKKLKAVNIIIPANIDTYNSPEWIATNVREFDRRLNENIKAQGSSEIGPPRLPVLVTFPRKTIAVKALSMGEAAEGQIPMTPMKVVTSHEWLRCMEKFATHISSFWDETIERFDKRFGDEQGDGAKATVMGIENDVVVALIDDGVASCNDAFVGRILEGKTFDYHDEFVGQYYISANGHGTEMARSILRVCPMAKIYPIRLKTHSSDGGAQIDLLSAALAIEAALEKNATIISMSWTIPIPSENTTEKERFNAALTKACNRKVLMFCSSPDKGQFTDNLYPAAVKRDSVFRIGAANDDGTAYSYAGRIPDLDFIFPGVRVNGNSAIGGDLKEITGSSIATALAAGLAATIIYCVKASALAAKTAMTQKSLQTRDMSSLVFTEEHVRKITEHASMQAAFSKVGEVNDGRFIQVWDSFEPANQMFESGSPDHETKLQVILKLCSHLIKQ